MRKLRVGTLPSNSGGQFLSLKDGDNLQLTILCGGSEIVSVDQFSIWDFNPAPVWVDCGDDDPGYELGLRPSYRAFLPVLVTIDGTPQVRIWSVGLGLHRDLVEIDEMSGGLEGLIVRAKRSGSGLKTRYTVVSTGKHEKSMPSDVPSTDDIIATLGPEDRSGILDLLRQRTGMGFEALKAKMTAGKDSVEVEEL